MKPNDNLVLPVARLRRRIQRDLKNPKVTTSAAIALTAGLQYVVEEVIAEAAANAHKNQRVRINPRDIFLVLAVDDMAMKKLLGRPVIPDSGVVKTLNFVRKKAQ